MEGLPSSRTSLQEFIAATPSLKLGRGLEEIERCTWFFASWHYTILTLHFEATEAKSLSIGLTVVTVQSEKERSMFSVIHAPRFVLHHSTAMHTILGRSKNSRLDNKQTERDGKYLSFQNATG